MTLNAKLSALLVLIAVLVLTAFLSFQFGNRYGTNAVTVKAQQGDISRLEAGKAAVDARLIENDAIRLGQAFNAKQENQSHAQEIKDIRVAAQRELDKRVRFNKALICGSASEAQGTTAGGDGQADTGEGVFPEYFGRRLYQLKSDAEEVATDLRSLKRSVEAAECFQ